MTNIAENLKAVHARMDSAAKDAERSPEDIQLICVSKTRPARDVHLANCEGEEHFGENYLQESVEKIAQIGTHGVTWHFIGPIQSNKTRPIAELFDWVHSVDRIKIAERLSRQRPEALGALNILLQINISHEASKSGLLENEIEEALKVCCALPNLQVRGFMAIPEATDDKALQHANFGKMNNLLKKYQQSYPQLTELSMGMSGDLEAAIHEGATMVRIGTDIFGKRNYS